MDRLLFVALIAFSALAGCGGLVQPCVARKCASVTVLEITDSTGAQVNDFSGFVISGNDRVPVGCGTALAPDAGSAPEDVSDYAPPTCEWNHLRFYSNAFGSDFGVEVSSGAKRFNGVVTVTPFTPEPSAGQCGGSCSEQRGSVILQ